jgi:hypothetical protein
MQHIGTMPRIKREREVPQHEKVLFQRTSQLKAAKEAAAGTRGRGNQCRSKHPTTKAHQDHGSASTFDLGHHSKPSQHIFKLVAAITPDLELTGMMACEEI